MKDEDRRVDHICAKSISVVFEYLGINKDFHFSSGIEYSRDLSAADKLIAMADVLQSNDYINSPGGKLLYNKEYFAKKGISLSFIEIEKYKYSQNTGEFIPYLSMIDVLMWNNKEQVVELLTKYKLV